MWASCAFAECRAAISKRQTPAKPPATKLRDSAIADGNVAALRFCFCLWFFPSACRKQKFKTKGADSFQQKENCALCQQLLQSRCYLFKRFNTSSVISTVGAFHITLDAMTTSVNLRSLATSPTTFFTLSEYCLRASTTCLSRAVRSF